MKGAKKKKEKKKEKEEANEEIKIVTKMEIWGKCNYGYG